MSREQLPNVDEWIRENPLRQSLQSVDPANPPDDSFRTWQDNEREVPLCHYDRMSDHELARSYAPLRSPRHIATALLLQHTEARTIPALTEELNKRLGATAAVPTQRVREAVNDLVATNYLHIDKDAGTPYRYIPEPYFATLAAQAGYLGEFVAKYGTPPVNILGADERGVAVQREYKQEKNGTSDATQYTVDRIRIIREINKTKVYQGREQAEKGLPLSMTTLSHDLGIPLQQARGHLEALIQSGFINKQSMKPGKSYQSYTVNPARVADLGETDKKGNDWTALFTEEIKNNPENITSDTLSERLRQIIDPRGIMSDDEALHLKNYVQRRLMKLAKDGRLIRTGQFSFDRRSTIILNPHEGQIHKMRDLTLALLSMQEAEQPGREKEGLILGKKLIDDRERLIRCVIEAQQDSRWNRQQPNNNGQLFLYKA